MEEWILQKNTWALCKYFFDTNLTKGQEKIVRTVAFDEYKRITICCMTRYGKSWSVAQGILLWIMLNPGKRIVIIAPTNEKTTIIRNYVAFFVSKNDILLNLLDLDKKGPERIKKEVSKRRMTWKNNVEMRTLSAEGKGEQLMGFGADKIIVDETCDIDFEVYRSKITRMLGDSPDSSYIEIGNPQHRDNHFWLHWTDPNYFRLHIDYEEALNEGRVDSVFIEEQKSQLTSREFEVLYKANFPESAEDQLIDWNWIERAYKVPMEIKGEIIAGIDIAELGNDFTVLIIGIKDKELSKYKVIHIESWNKIDLMPTVAKILPFIDKFKIERIKVDATGVGSGVYSRLDELYREGRIKCQVKAHKGGLRPSTDKAAERFLNEKAESYWHLRKLFEENKINIPNHRELISQLNKMKWELTSSEKIRIRNPGEKEGDTAEEKSPDFSDALNIMAWDGGIPNLVFGLASFK
jgi:hypothetical protein